MTLSGVYILANYLYFVQCLWEIPDGWQKSDLPTRIEMARVQRCRGMH